MRIDIRDSRPLSGEIGNEGKKVPVKEMLTCLHETAKYILVPGYNVTSARMAAAKIRSRQSNENISRLYAADHRRCRLFNFFPFFL